MSHKHKNNPFKIKKIAGDNIVQHLPFTVFLTARPLFPLLRRNMVCLSLFSPLECSCDLFPPVLYYLYCMNYPDFDALRDIGNRSSPFLI